MRVSPQSDSQNQKKWRLRRAVIVALGIVLGLGSPAGPVGATEARKGDAVQISNEDIMDDLFIAAGDVNVDAHIVGDLFAAGATISLGDSAVVENSFYAVGRRVDVNGRVINSARLWAQDIDVGGHIEGNMMAFCGTMILGKGGWVENDLSLYGGELVIRGRVGRNVRGKVGQLVIAGQVDGDVHVDADEITILPTAIIGGKLIYRSRKEAKIEDGAQIFNGVERIEKTKKKHPVYTMGGFLWDTWGLLCAVLVGFVLLFLFRRFVNDVKDTALDSSLKSLGLGFLFFVCIPVAAGMLVITILGIPLAVLTMIGWGVMLYLSKILVGLATGEWLLTRLRSGRASPPIASLLVGLILLTIVGKIPYAGILARIMIISLGFGAFLITAYRARMRTRNVSQA